MLAYMAKRLFNGVLVLLIISTFMFVVINIAPGGPSILMSDDLTAEQVERLTENLGLNQPLPVQYLKWLGSLASGDFGVSLVTGRSVALTVLERVPATLLLGASALLFAVMISIPVGIMSAVRRNSLFDYFGSGVAFLGVSLPIFWFALMLILLFSVQLGWFPSAGMYSSDDHSLINRFHHLVLPTIALGIAEAAELTRYVRSSFLDVLDQDYIRTARGKGVPERRVIYGHALRNARITIVSVIGVSLPRLIGGAAVAEVIFAWPGMGRLTVSSAIERDYPVVMGVTITVGVVVILINLLVDMLYPILDPRIDLTRKRAA